MVGQWDSRVGRFPAAKQSHRRREGRIMRITVETDNRSRVVLPGHSNQRFVVE
jgi:hypothetical protein